MLFSIRSSISAGSLQIIMLQVITLSPFLVPSTFDVGNIVGILDIWCQGLLTIF